MNQAQFTAALLDPTAAVPDGLTDSDGAPTTKRFNVYRNNVAVSLTEALEVGFPVLKQLLGGNFTALAGVYLRAHPPRTPVMAHFGEQMPSFLASFEPLAHLPYLPDIARVEMGLRTAYHASDAPALDPARLSELTDTTRLIFAPAVQVVPSRFALHDLWVKAQNPEAPQPGAAPQHLLITRPDFDPQLFPLTPEASATVTALMQGAPVAEALTTPEAGELLGLLLRSAALTDLET